MSKIAGSKTLVLESAFSKATGRDWHAGFISPEVGYFDEIDIQVRLRGRETSQFFLYVIKTGLEKPGRKFAFTFKDTGKVPFKGDGSDIRLLCKLYYS